MHETELREMVALVYETLERLPIIDHIFFVATRSCGKTAHALAAQTGFAPDEITRRADWVEHHLATVLL